MIKFGVATLSTVIRDVLILPYIPSINKQPSQIIPGRFQLGVAGNSSSIDGLKWNGEHNTKAVINVIMHIVSEAKTTKESENLQLENYVLTTKIIYIKRTKKDSIDCNKSKTREKELMQNKKEKR